MFDYYSSKKITFRPQLFFAKISSHKNYFSKGKQEHLQLLSSSHHDKLALHFDSNSTEQIPNEYEVLGPIKDRMELRDAFQNICHHQFCTLINKVLGPNSGNKLTNFSKYYHYCHFVYIKCAIIIYLRTEPYHYRKTQKKN